MSVPRSKALDRVSVSLPSPPPRRRLWGLLTSVTSEIRGVLDDIKDLHCKIYTLREKIEMDRIKAAYAVKDEELKGFSHTYNIQPTHMYLLPVLMLWNFNASVRSHSQNYN